MHKVTLLSAALIAAATFATPVLAAGGMKHSSAPRRAPRATPASALRASALSRQHPGRMRPLASRTRITDPFALLLTQEVRNRPADISAGRSLTGTQGLHIPCAMPLRSQLTDY